MTHVRLDNILPSNYFVNRTESNDFSFDFTEEPLNLPISLRMFYPSDDVFDSMLFQEFSKSVPGILTVQGRYELSSVVR